MQVFDRAGRYLAEWGDFYHPMQIWIDERDLVFVTDQIPRISLLTLTARGPCGHPRKRVSQPPCDEEEQRLPTESGAGTTQCEPVERACDTHELIELLGGRDPFESGLTKDFLFH